MKNPDRLYDLLPAVYRMRDVDQGYPLKELLRVVTEQVDLVEANIAQLYENWFIETCEDWVVPYIGDLVGYEVLNDSGEPASVNSPRALERERILISRRDVANTIHDRRRKGTAHLMQGLAEDAAGWPATAVEFFRRLGWTQNLHTPLLNRPRYHRVKADETLATIATLHRLTEATLLWLNPSISRHIPLVAGTHLLIGSQPARGQTVDLHDIDRLEHLPGPFDRIAHTAGIRRINSHRADGFHNIPSAGVFVWRLRNYTVGLPDATAAGNPPARSWTPAYCREDEGPYCFTFSILGNDTPLFNRPQAVAHLGDDEEELSLPTRIRRRHFADHPGDYYGANASLCLWAPDWPAKGQGMPVPASAIKIADLDQWFYRAPNESVIIDPERGRIVFPVRHPPKQGVFVYYNYGFSADIGGGEYRRTLSHPAEARIYFVGTDGDYVTINDALQQWETDKKAIAPPNPAPAEGAARATVSAVIEITDSAAYTEKLTLELDPYESLQIRASQGRRPTLRLLDYLAGQADALSVSGGQSSRLTLDGLLITGRGLLVRGPERGNVEDRNQTPGDLCDITIRHCTLVPGWGLECNCDPSRPSEPSIEVFESTAKIRIEHSILGAIRITSNEAETDPVELCLSDSLWDATDNDLFVLTGPEEVFAYARLTIARCTVFGRILTHEINLAENCIFDAEVCVARRQQGCVRFCYVEPCSRTPRRYECQPDLVRQAVQDRFLRGEITTAPERDAEIVLEEGRVEPAFNSTRYGTPTYGQLADTCATEISTGADDESEMGVFHDLYQPQRAANLRTRLDEFTPAGMNAGIITAT
jgi:hypothetical protein